YAALVVVSLAVVVACALLGSWFALLALAAYAFLWPALGVLRSGAVGRDLIPVLARTGQFQLIWSVLLAIGLALHRFL
ncbi:MAG TPA: 1,4-dihydroxy-2-naphthoate polyprenyltransferase, partial [Lapillicoccus sp.]|nr:1,4-dihydroxy-2-naphthoate polyprenyltransferase [Lapillicoccus sp.]